MNNFFNNVIGWTKKPTSPRFVYPTAAKFCCCLPYKARRGCDRLFAYVSTQAREEKRPFCYYRVTTFLLLKTVLASNIQVTVFFCIVRMFWPRGERSCWQTTMRKKKSTPQTPWKNVPGKQPNFFLRTKIEWTASKQNWTITQLCKARCFLNKSLTPQTTKCSAWSCNYFYIVLTYARTLNIFFVFCFCIITDLLSMTCV